MSTRKFTPNVNVRRILSGALSALLVAASLTVVAATAPAVVLPTAVADAPSSQPAPVSVYNENFENGLTATTTGVIQTYAGAGGQTYTTSPAWQSNCDGVVISGNLPDATSTAGLPNGCAGQPSWYAFWNELRNMAKAIENWRTGTTISGTSNPANGNHIVSAYTLSTSTNLPATDQTVLQTATPLAVSAGRFYSLSLDAIFESCELAHPSIFFKLGAVQLNTTALDPCTTGTKITYPSSINAIGIGGATRDAWVQQLISNPIILSTGSSFNFQVLNTQSLTNGNDGGFDNFQLLDVTPSLGVAYQYSQTPLHSVETLTYTVENTTDNNAKPGFSFTQTLPSGVVRSGSAVGGTCTNPTNTAGTTATITNNSPSSLTIGGSLPAVTSCTIVINVTSSGTAAVGRTYTSAIADFTNLVGIKTDANLPSSTTFTTVTAVNDSVHVNAGSSANAIAVKTNDSSGASSPANPNAALGTPFLSGTAASPVLTGTSAHGGALSVITTGPNAGQVQYTPQAGFSGADTFTYNVCDQTPGTPNCASATVSVQVDNGFITPGGPGTPGTPDVPNGTGSVTDSTGQNVTKVFQLSDLITTTGAAIDPTLITQVGSAPHGGTIAIDTTTGAVSYVPKPGYSGPDSFVLHMCDKATPSQCYTVNVTMTVGPNIVDAVNDGPVSVSAGVATPIDVRVNDTTTTGTALGNPFFGSISSPSSTGTSLNGGALSVITTGPNAGKVQYTPPAAFSGADTFTYNLCDISTPTPFCDSMPATVTVQVNNGFITPGGPGTPGTPDVPNGTGSVTASTGQNVTKVFQLSDLITTTGAAIDPTLITQVGSAPNGGTISINPSTGAVSYVPKPGYSGPDSFVLHMCDKATPSQCYTVNVTMTVGPNIVDAVNDGPVSVSAGVATPIDVRVNDTTTTGTALGNPFFGSISSPSSTGTSLNGGALSVITTGPNAGKVQYTPPAAFSGADTFTYNLCDISTPTPFCDSMPATVTVQVNNGFITPGGPGTPGTPDVPNGTGSATGNTPQNAALPFPLSSLITVTGSPINPTTISQVGAAPSNGSISINTTTGAVTYTPSSGYTGPDSFVLHMCDTATPSQCYTVNVAVVVGPNVVLAVDDTRTDTINTPLEIDVINNDTTQTGQPLDPGSVTVTSNPSNGTVTVSPKPSALGASRGFVSAANAAGPAWGSIVYTPKTGFVGSDSFKYRVCDTSRPTPVCSTATVFVTISFSLVTLAFTGSQGPGLILLVGGGALLAGIILLLLRRRGQDRRTDAKG